MQRIPYIDTTRGLLLAIMAIDHVRSFVHKSHPSEWWSVGLPEYHGDLIAFITRLVTHACPTGFFFLMGVSMSLYVIAMKEQNSNIDPRKYFAVRGGVLILLQLFIVNIAWLFGGMSAEVPKENYGVDLVPGSGKQIFIYIGVLAALGLSMIVSSFLLQMRSLYLLIVFSLVEFGSIFLIANGVPETDTVVALRVLGVPGQSGAWMVRYSLLPWMGLTLLGIIVGRLISKNKATASHFTIAASILFFMFVGLRFLSLGDYNQQVESGFIGFFNTTKYPASLVYQLFALSIVFIMIAITMSLPGRWQTPLMTLGKATLFFYVTHLYLYGAIGYLFPTGGGWMYVFLSWLVGLFVLWIGCSWWSNKKRLKPKTHVIHLF